MNTPKDLAFPMFSQVLACIRQGAATEETAQNVEVIKESFSALLAENARLREACHKALPLIHAMSQEEFTDVADVDEVEALIRTALEASN